MPQVAKPPKKKLARKSSKYFCINEAGETQWLTDYDGDNMVEFIERHKAEPFFLYWSPEAVHSSNQEAPASLTRRTKAKGRRSKLAGAIVSVDDQVGKLLDVLEKRGLRRKVLQKVRGGLLFPHHLAGRLEGVGGPRGPDSFSFLRIPRISSKRHEPFIF